MTPSVRNTMNRLWKFPWLILACTLLTLYGWIGHESAMPFNLPAFYFKLLTLPLTLAILVGLNPHMAPFNPKDSRNFWHITTISLRLFLVLVVVTFVLFRLNR